MLKYYQDLTDSQIAAVLGWPVGSVKSAQHRAVAALRLLLEEEERWRS